MAAEIYAIGARGRLWNVETIAITGKWVGGVHRNRELTAGLEIDSGHLERLQGIQVAMNQVIRFFPVEIFDARDGIAQFRQQAILNLPARECD